jgi:hypothetical protein
MSETDSELGAAWRSASREQPPAALDDAIRAAARREVGARPGRMRAPPRWWPLAAAATVAAVAVGIVQMTPPGQVTPASFPAAMDAAPRAAKPDVAKSEVAHSTENGQQRDTAAAALPELKRDMLREEAKPLAKEQRLHASDEKSAGAGGRAGSFAAPPDAQFQEKKAMLQAPAQRREETREREQPLKQKTELAAASSVARQSSNVASAPAASTPSKEIQPFPAAPVPAEVAASNAPQPMASAAPAAAPPPAPAIAARKLAAQSSETGALSGNIAGNAVSGGASNAEPAAARDSAALGKVAVADADKAMPERRKDAAPLAPEEWIKRIRRLIAGGRNEDAAKELAAFRREYKERSDSLLPGDLRAFRQ